MTASIIAAKNNWKNGTVKVVITSTSGTKESICMYALTTLEPPNRFS
jgi:hypothetical protein